MHLGDPEFTLKFDLVTALVSAASLAAGAVITLAGLWFRRTWMPLVAVRVDAVESAGEPGVIRILLEAENLSLGKVNKKKAQLRIEPCLLPAPGEFHTDQNRKDCQLFAVMASTDKLEPREMVHTELLYRWGTAPSIRCVFSVTYCSWLSLFYFRRQDQHSVARWFVRGSHAEPSSGQDKGVASEPPNKGMQQTVGVVAAGGAPPAADA
jgi:hypothetical protein